MLAEEFSRRRVSGNPMMSPNAMSAKGLPKLTVVQKTFF
jgi:hypothetical protein